MSLAKGRSLTFYEILGPLGAGGMGEVYRARDTRLEREVAIKVLPEELADDEERLRRFEREAKTLASLNHSNVAQVFGIDQVDDTCFIAMELVQGEDLAARLARGALPVSEALDVCRQIAQGLEAAHEAGVVHRDLKPANVRITPEGVVKVLDFGLAKPAGPGAGRGSGTSVTAKPDSFFMTEEGVVLGTPTYMSPEQARARPVDRRTDIWAFGCVLYECLTGKRAFGGESMTDVLAAIVGNEPDWSALPASTPSAVRRVLVRCLVKDPGQRLRDVGDARIELTEADSRGESLPPQGSSVSPKWAWAGWGVAAVFLLLWLTHGEASGPPELPLRKMTLALDAEDPARDNQFEPRISPDGKHLVYVSHGRLWVRDLSGTRSHALPGTEGAEAPLWSPDSEWIAFARDERIEKVPITGGGPSLVAATTPGRAMTRSGAWGADGRLVFGTGTTGLLQVSARGGDVTTLLETQEGESDYHEVGGLPDGKGWILVIHKVDTGYGTLGIAQPDGTRREIVSFPGEYVADPCYSPTGHILFYRTGAAPGVWALPFSVERMEPTGQPFLVAAGAQRPSAADDGTLAYTSGVEPRRSRLLWMDRAGKALETIGEPLELLMPRPELSEDDAGLLVSGGSADAREIWFYDTVTGSRRQITFDGLLHDDSVFHPDGRRIFSGLNGVWSLQVTFLDGSEESRTIGPGYQPRLDRAGKRLFFVRGKDMYFDGDIYTRLLEEEDDAAELLIGGEGFQWNARLSPDERHLLYVSDESGREEVFLTTFPPTTQRWQVSRAGGSFPRWRADGAEIYYAVEDAIMAVEVDQASGLPRGEARLLFRRPATKAWGGRWPDGFDVSSDGQRFIVIENVHEEDSAPLEIVVVQNWFAEFESR